MINFHMKAEALLTELGFSQEIIEDLTNKFRLNSILDVLYMPLTALLEADLSPMGLHILQETVRGVVETNREEEDSKNIR